MFKYAHAKKILQQILSALLLWIVSIRVHNTVNIFQEIVLIAKWLLTGDS